MPRQATFDGHVDLAGSRQVGDVIAAADLFSQRAATLLVAADDEGRRAFLYGQPRGRRADAGRACDQANFIRKSSAHCQSLPITDRGARGYGDRTRKSVRVVQPRWRRRRIDATATTPAS